MKKIIVGIFLFFVLKTSFAQIFVVAPFEIRESVASAEDALAITELFSAKLSSMNDVKVSNRLNLEQALIDMNFTDADWADRTKTAKLGKAVNADIIVRGKIITLGNKNYLSASALDTQTALTLSSAQIPFSSIDTVFAVLDDLCKNLILPLSERIEIGDTGPGGGLVFHIEDDTYYECGSFLGASTWSEAKSLVKKYRGGNFNDWYLPNKDELNLIYINLRRKAYIGDNGWFWSSSSGANYAWIQSFSDGTQYSTNMLNDLGVRPIRSFTSNH